MTISEPLQTIPDPEDRSADGIASPKSNPGSSSTGCLQIGLLVLSGLWIVIFTAIAQFLSWALEQSLFEGSLPVTDLRWLVALGYGLALFVPLLLVALFVKSVWLRPIFQAWTFASALAIVLFPARLIWITSQQAVNLAQIIGLFILLISLMIFRRRRIDSPKITWAGNPLAVILALALAIPWVLYEAFGSPLDTILNLAVGLLLGATTAFLIDLMIASVKPSRETRYSLRQMLLYGCTTALALLILSTAAGQNGSELLLAAILPVLGWPTLALSLYGKANEGKIALPAAALFIGLAASCPLMFVDPDELALVISSGTGELIDWVIRTSAWVLAIAFVITIALLVAFRRIQIARGWSWLARLAPLAGLAIITAIYLLFGHPGFYGERLFVILKDQADVSQAYGMKDYNARRSFVYTTLVSHANQTQSSLRQRLDQIGVHYTPYYLVNGLEVQAGPLVRIWLETRPEVDRILASPILRPLPAAVPVSTGEETATPAQPQWNLTMIGAPKVWQMGIDGKGIVIGQSDSGVQGDHPELQASYRGTGGHDDYNWYDPWNHSTQPQDIGGHGTHTTATIVGKTTGVAPGAKWMACVNLARNLGNPAFYLDCMQFMLAPFPQNGDPFKDGKPELGAQILNDSWGCPVVEGCDANVFLPAARALRAAGIFVVVSAGNSGYSGCGSVKDPPAIYQEVYSVGAVDQNGALATFSSLGPVTIDGSRRVKPDIVAPGEGVLSAFPGSTYSTLSGTSMAGPHVVGVVALMWSANPALIGDIDATTVILDQTAKQSQGAVPACVDGNDRPNGAYGYGIVDAYAAVQKALGK